MRRNLFLLAALVASVAANLAVRPDPARPNVEVIPEMVRSISYKAYAANPNFPDGKTLQLPPPGTIPRSTAPLPSGARADSTSRGQAVFQAFCVVCHGPAGKGDGPVAQRGFPPPPPLAAPHAVGLADSEIFHILTYGQKNMPSYAVQISAEDRWNVIRYVRSLQPGSPGGGPAGPTAAPSSASQPAAQGRTRGSGADDGVRPTTQEAKLP